MRVRDGFKLCSAARRFRVARSGSGQIRRRIGERDGGDGAVPRALGQQLAAHELNLVGRPLAEQSVRHAQGRLAEGFRLGSFYALDARQRYVAGEALLLLLGRETLGGSSE